jgi:hypothetical protein
MSFFHTAYINFYNSFEFQVSKFGMLYNWVNLLVILSTESNDCEQKYQKQLLRVISIVESFISHLC